MIGLKRDIGTVAHVGSQQAGWNLALNSKLALIKIPLFVNGSIIALQVGKGA